MDPFNYNQIRRYLTLTFFLICFLLLCTQVFGAEKILQSNIKPIKPEEVNGQYCFVKVVIKQKGDEIIKEEILECADGKRNPQHKGYWELFAEFYYHDVNTPEYCRKYDRPNHVFKSYGIVCLDKNGEWEVK